MGTAGPGASHLCVGLADALSDYSPILVVSGQVPIHQVGYGGFQELDYHRLYKDLDILNHSMSSTRQTGKES